MSRIEVPVGIVGVGLNSEQREVPDGTPPAWRDNQSLAQVGKSPTRIDGADKVSGRARYTADIVRPGMLHAKVLRSPHPHARVHRVDLSEALKMPGVKAAVVLPHLLGIADDGSARSTLVNRVRYYGQPVAAVAAQTLEQTVDALSKIKVDYDVLPFVVDREEARKPTAPKVFEQAVTARGSAGGGGSKDKLNQQGNIRGPRRSAPRGRDVDKQAAQVTQALLAGPHGVRATYKTQVQTHSALETHGMVAEWDRAKEELTVWASTQGIFSVRDDLAEYLDIPATKVRVITDFCGGGFGAKFGAGNYGVLAALLAKEAGAPVRLVLDRREEHLAVGNRPGSEQNIALAAAADGKLTAIEVKGFGFGGAGAGAGFGGPALSMYDCPAVYVEESDVFTHSGPLAAFRAPGHPQGAFALEQAMDELAERLHVDPLTLRDLNDSHPARREERKRTAASFGWSSRTPTGQGPRLGKLGEIRRGIGLAQGCWYHLVNLESSAEVRIHRDGSVEILTGVQDIGGGVRTPLAQVVAEELQLSIDKIKVTIGDTRLPPGPGSGGSVTTASITPATREAAYAAKQALLKELQAVLSLDQQPELQGGNVVGVKGGKPITPLPFAKACARMRRAEVLGSATRQPDYGATATGKRGNFAAQLGGVQMVEVEVNTFTGVVKVLRVVAAHDCGRPVNPLLVHSQIHGGIIQGISYALFEERRLDPRTGRVLNGNFEQYKIAGALDVPKIDVILLEELRGRSSTDVSGIGEPATVPTAAAVANAVYNAIGVRIRELPITPARVLAALASQRGDAKP
ncbi:MAG: xanthine dehydrogenase family protein molybdopterin-binding subunit [Myxococcales bacterium]|nr:xanthine dehydrogenase family protein molybdopterin-binding subunit [Myxococcales bacterium]